MISVSLHKPSASWQGDATVQQYNYDHSRRYDTYRIDWQLCWDDVKFTSWQRPAAGHGARIAVHVPLIINIVMSIIISD